MFFSLRASLLFALVFFSIAAASQTTLPAAVAPPVIAAKAYLLVDILSGQTLVAVNADEPREPASLTKLMTAYLVFRALKDQELTPSQMAAVSEKAWRAEGSRMFIDPKKAVSVDELLHGEIVQSGNDAAIALAEVTAGSEAAFVERMNREAARMGMKGTRFVNVTGLPAPQQVSTATDLGLIAAAVIRDFPEYYPLYSIKEYRYNNAGQVTALKVGRAATASAPAGFVVDQYVTLPKGQAAQLKLTLEAIEPLVAPITRGQRVGLVKVTLDTKPVGEYPLVALEEVPLTGLFGRAWDTIRLWFK